MTDSIKIGVSSCLLGEHVRYDGGHKHDRYITDQVYLSPHPAQLMLRNHV